MAATISAHDITTNTNEHVSKAITTISSSMVFLECGFGGGDAPSHLPLPKAHHWQEIETVKNENSIMIARKPPDRTRLPGGTKLAFRFDMTRFPEGRPP